MHKMMRNNWLVLGILYFFIMTSTLSLSSCGGGGGSNGGGSTSVPTVPPGVSATAGNSTVTIDWSSVSGATAYNIYWSTVSGVTKSNGNKIASITSPYVHTGRSNGTNYYYIVTAVNASGESSESTEVSAVPQPPAPGVPNGVSALAGNGKVTLSWNAVTGATGYNLYWSNSPGVSKTNGTKISNVSSAYSHTGLTNGATYYYVVTAINGSESSISSQVSAKPQLPAPSGNSVSSGDTTVTIQWNAVTGATGYNIYWSNAAGVNKTNGTKISNVASAYTLTGLSNGLTYYYVITAFDGSSESPESSELSATPQVLATGAPTGLVATAANSKVTLTWDAVAGATTYNIYYLNTSGVTTADGNLISNVTSPYIHASLANGTKYYYVVTAVNPGGESPISTEVSARPVVVNYSFAKEITGVTFHFGAYEGTIAVDSLGNVYVTDVFNYRIQKFDSNGKFLLQWGSNGTGAGQFKEPTGIAIDSSDNVYVTDFTNRTVQKFDSSGTYVVGWTVPSPSGIVYSASYLYVVQAGYKINVYDTNGTFVRTWGSLGSGTGQFGSNYWMFLGVDSSGRIYAVDYPNYRVQYFNTGGTYLGEWAITGVGGNIVFDSSGVAYVATNTTVQQFQSGAKTGEWGSGGSNDGQFSAIRSIAINRSSNSVYVLDAGHGRIQKLSTNGTFNTKWGSWGNSSEPFKSPTGIAVYNDYLYITDSANHKIKVYSTNGIWSRESGTAGFNNGQFDTPTGIVLDGTGNIFVSDMNNSRIQKLNNAGTFLTTWGSSGAGNGQFACPYGIAIDGSNQLYVADNINNRIQKFDLSGAYVTQWGSSGSGNGQFNQPFGIGVDFSKNIFVADHYNQRVQKFDQNKLFTFKWGSLGGLPGQFRSPAGIAVDSYGDVYVADQANHRIQKFDNDGTFIAELGSNGSGNGQFNYPQGVTVDSLGNLYVADTQNNRVQIFTPAP